MELREFLPRVDYSFVLDNLSSVEEDDSLRQNRYRAMRNYSDIQYTAFPGKVERRVGSVAKSKPN